MINTRYKALTTSVTFALALTFSACSGDSHSHSEADCGCDASPGAGGSQGSDAGESTGGKSSDQDPTPATSLCEAFQKEGDEHAETLDCESGGSVGAGCEQILELAPECVDSLNRLFDCGSAAPDSAWTCEDGEATLREECDSELEDLDECVAEAAR